MYSPKIKKDLVRRLYKLRQCRQKKVPMTRLVKEAVEQYLTKYEKKENNEVKNEKN